MARYIDVTDSFAALTRKGKAIDYNEANIMVPDKTWLRIAKINTSYYNGLIFLTHPWYYRRPVATLFYISVSPEDAYIKNLSADKNMSFSNIRCMNDSDGRYLEVYYNSGGYTNKIMASAFGADQIILIAPIISPGTGTVEGSWSL